MQGPPQFARRRAALAIGRFEMERVVAFNGEEILQWITEHAGGFGIARARDIVEKIEAVLRIVDDGLAGASFDGGKCGLPPRNRIGADDDGRTGAVSRK